MSITRKLAANAAKFPAQHSVAGARVMIEWLMVSFSGSTAAFRLCKMSWFVN